ncbi:MAG TPA: ribose ABC transporter substrate-binding protein RbsB [Mollicutes bacterium]|nr:ribose ABC transporter substrate-binding protein RbsB [Mollicutes bacterium]
MKKFLSLTILSAFVLLAVTGCFGKDDKKGTIGLSVSTLNNPFFVDLKDGVQEKADELGYEVIVYDAQDDSAKQLNDVEDLISKKVDIIIINPTDSDAVGTAITAANEAGIPIVTVDRSANSGEVATHVASDNVKGGRMAGEYLLELVGEGAKVLELQGVLGASATVDRGQGFHEAVDGKLNVVASKTANFNRSEGLSVTEDLLEAHSDVKGIFAHNDEMALGAVQALAAKNITDVVVIGFDATDDAKEAVENETMAATVAQQPKLMGTLSVEFAVKILLGEEVADYIAVDLALVK